MRGGLYRCIQSTVAVHWVMSTVRLRFNCFDYRTAALQSGIFGAQSWFPTNYGGGFFLLASAGWRVLTPGAWHVLGVLIAMPATVVR